MTGPPAKEEAKRSIAIQVVAAFLALGGGVGLVGAAWQGASVIRGAEAVTITVSGSILGLAPLAWLCATSIPVARLNTTKELPTAARDTIRRAAGAARQQDWQDLRREMVDQFTWDFGSDANADQAIAEWKQDPRPVREFGRHFYRRCRLVAPARIDCLGRRPLDLRAGFVLSGGVWKMSHLVAGD